MEEKNSGRQPNTKEKECKRCSTTQYNGEKREKRCCCPVQRRKERKEVLAASIRGALQRGACFKYKQ